MVVSVFWLCLPSVCPVASYIQYLIHWPNTFYTPSLSKYGLFKPFSIWPFPKPWFTHMLWLKLKGWFEQNQCFLRQNRLLHKELFYTKTVLYTNTMFYTKAMFLLGLCKGCLRLTGWLFPWWLNTPKAVKYVQKLGQLFTTKSSGWRKTKQGGRKYESFAREGKCWYVAKCFLNIDLIDDNNNYC